ncbi:MAG: hypothetical protein K0S76_2805 [Herbinix sp.]|jgi:hypothetical protein|nr:hypothetical protein [Herbinix sp.]
MIKSKQREKPSDHKINRKIIGRIITVAIPLFGVLLILLKNYAFIILRNLPACPIYEYHHLYCPGCGNTRSVAALLNGDILKALRFNIVPFLLGVFVLIAYIELVTYSFGKHLRLVPRSNKFYITTSIILVLYYIFRNFIPYLTP